MAAVKRPPALQYSVDLFSRPWFHCGTFKLLEGH